MTLEIDYESDGFAPSAPVANGPGTLTTSWNELLWAALTVGRPNRHYVFKHGSASIYEALFRLSLVRMALEQGGPRAWRLRRTAAASTLDPSEKGAINYFLGLSICKLFAARLLNAPWLLHLDVFRPALNLVLSGRSRPDLVGETLSGNWVALECKGRISTPHTGVKNNAKQQAQRVVSVNGVAPTFRIGGIAYFRNETLQFFWRDPDPEGTVKNPIEINLVSDMWRHYYMPLLELLRVHPEEFARMMREPFLMSVEAADIKVGIHPVVLRALVESRWDQARKGLEPPTIHGSALPYQVDGIAVVAGESWRLPFEEPTG